MLFCLSKNFKILQSFKSTAYALIVTVHSFIDTSFRKIRIFISNDFFMKKVLLLIACAGIIVCSCGGQEKTMSKKTDDTTKISDTIRLASDKLEHEIIIFEPGFSAWMQGYARPRNYYSQNFLEARNRVYVTEWNQRVLQPARYNNQWYEQEINYRPNVNYGYEVNYQLYYYFVFFQQKYKQQLAAFPVRI